MDKKILLKPQQSPSLEHDEGGHIGQAVHVEKLNDWDFHYQPNEESNSIAIIIQHMSGNKLSRWTNFLDEDGEKEWRQRDDEFEVHSYNKQQLIEQ